MGKKRLDWAEIVRLRDEEGLTFEEIGKQMGKPRGTIQKAYQRAKAEGSKPEVYQESKPPSKPKKAEGSKPRVYQESKLPSKPKPEAEETPGHMESKPEVYQGSKLEGLLPQLEEIVSWWRQRKKTLSKPIGVSKKRQTYILSDELIEAVKDYAHRKGIPITEAINEIIRRGLTEA